MKVWVIYSVAVTIVAVAGISFAVGVVVTGALDDNGSANVQATAEPTAPPTQRPEPTEYAPRLTGAEAAAAVKAEFLRLDTPEEKAIGLQLECDPEDFNQQQQTWIVSCQHAPTGFSFRARVDDRTGEVTILG